MPLVEIKDFNALIDNQQFFDQPVKIKQGSYEKRIEISRNDEYTTGNLLDYFYHQNNYKLIGIDLSRQANTSIPQQINFTEKSSLSARYNQKLSKLLSKGFERSVYWNENKTKSDNKNRTNEFR